MYLAVVAFTGPDTFQVQVEEVGRFNSEEEAASAMDDFVEGVLEIERPGYEQLAKKVFEL